MTVAVKQATMTRNITRVFREATPAQFADGMAWYSDAHTLALSLASQHDGDVDRAAGVIAALSPQVPWDRNVILATRMYVEGELTGGIFGASIRSATRIYHGEDWRNVFGRYAFKVRAFAECINTPTHPTAVCIDRHASDIADGAPSGASGRVALNSRQYGAYADAYRRASNVLGYSPAQVQATTWVVWRETRIRIAASVAAKAELRRQAS